MINDPLFSTRAQIQNRTWVSGIFKKLDNDEMGAIILNDPEFGKDWEIRFWYNNLISPFHLQDFTHVLFATSLRGVKLDNRTANQFPVVVNIIPDPQKIRSHYTHILSDPTIISLQTNQLTNILITIGGDNHEAYGAFPTQFEGLVDQNDESNPIRRLCPIGRPS